MGAAAARAFDGCRARASVTVSFFIFGHLSFLTVLISKIFSYNRAARKQQASTNYPAKYTRTVAADTSAVQVVDSGAAGDVICRGDH